MLMPLCLQVSQEQIRSPELRSYRSAEPSYMLTSTFVASGEKEAADIPTLFPHSQGGAKRWGWQDVQPACDPTNSWRVWNNYCILWWHTNFQSPQFPTGRFMVINATNNCTIPGPTLQTPFHGRVISYNLNFRLALQLPCKLVAKAPPVVFRPKVTKQPPVSTSNSRAKPSTDDVNSALPSGENTWSEKAQDSQDGKGMRLNEWLNEYEWVIEWMVDECYLLTFGECNDNV